MLPPQTAATGSSPTVADQAAGVTPTTDVDVVVKSPNAAKSTVSRRNEATTLNAAAEVTSLLMTILALNLIVMLMTLLLALHRRRHYHHHQPFIMRQLQTLSK